MRTACVRGIAAILSMLMVVGCGPQPKPYTPPTLEELKQLTDVTDRVLDLARSSDRDTALREAIAAVGAAYQQYRQHSVAIVNRENVDATSCIHAYAMEIGDLETFIARRDEAARRQDKVMASRRTAMLRSRAMDMWRCAVVSTGPLIDREQRRDALKHAAIVMSEAYATATIARTAADLPIAPLLEDQIRTYEKIVAKLGPKHESQIVTDALPKLKATLATIEQSPGL